MELDYEKDIHIDEDSLDYEWLQQTTLAVKYGKYWAECQERLIRAEERIKIIRSQLIKEANEDPDHFLGEGVKPTNPNVEAYYRTHSDHKRAKEEWIEAQYQANLADVVRKEISMTRKKALESLVSLHGQQYFAGPSTPHNLTELRERKVKQMNKGINEHLKQTKKRTRHGKKE